MTMSLSEVLERAGEGAALDLSPPADAQGPPRLELARTFVRQASAVVEALNHAVDAPDEVGFAVRSSVLHAALPVLLEYRRTHTARARDLLSWIWAAHAAAFGVVAPGELESVLPKPAIAPIAPTPDDQECLEMLDQAIHEYLRDIRAGEEARRMLRELLTTLAISTDELGRIFQVSGETVRRWEHNRVAVPAGKQAEITAAGAALRRLRSFFRPERLPLVIRRRPAPLFDGESALDWILRGRIREVADRYDRLLSYEPEAVQQLATEKA
jgi:hypothetical protein